MIADASNELAQSGENALLGRRPAEAWLGIVFFGLGLFDRWWWRRGRWSMLQLIGLPGDHFDIDRLVGDQIGGRHPHDGFLVQAHGDGDAYLAFGGFREFRHMEGAQVFVLGHPLGFTLVQVDFDDILLVVCGGDTDFVFRGKGRVGWKKHLEGPVQKTATNTHGQNVDQADALFCTQGVAEKGRATGHHFVRMYSLGGGLAEVLTDFGIFGNNVLS